MDLLQPPQQSAEATLPTLPTPSSVTLPTPEEFGELLDSVMQGQLPVDEDSARKTVAAIAIAEIIEAEQDSDTSSSSSDSGYDLWAVVTSTFLEASTTSESDETERQEVDTERVANGISQTRARARYKQRQERQKLQTIPGFRRGSRTPR